MTTQTSATFVKRSSRGAEAKHDIMTLKKYLLAPLINWNHPPGPCKICNLPLLQDVKKSIKVGNDKKVIF